jgi:hypothetical protein
MTTLVLSPRYTSDARALHAAATADANWKVERLGSWRVPDRLQQKDVALYGEATFVEVIASRLGLALLDAPFDWLLHLPERYRQRTMKLSTASEARSFTHPAFIKPADGRKSFESKIYPSGEYLPSLEALPNDTAIMVVEPVLWEIEFRCFVLERRVTTLSPYLRRGNLVLNDERIWEASEEEFAQARALMDQLLSDQEVRLPPAIVVDVGKLRHPDETESWAVIEANACWGAGIYGCDPASVLPVLERACIRREKLQPGDAEWTLAAIELVD